MVWFNAVTNVWLLRVVNVWLLTVGCSAAWGVPASVGDETVGAAIAVGCWTGDCTGAGPKRFGRV